MHSTTSNELHAHLFIAVARLRAVELACAVSVFFYLGYEIGRNWL